MAGCAAKQTKKPEDDFAQDTVEPAKDVAWPEAQRPCGDNGNWCAPLTQVQPVAHDANASEGGEESTEGDTTTTCPEQFMREPFDFTLDVEATASSMSGNCCYAYQSERCMP